MKQKLKVVDNNLFHMLNAYLYTNIFLDASTYLKDFTFFRIFFMMLTVLFVSIGIFNCVQLVLSMFFNKKFVYSFPINNTEEFVEKFINKNGNNSSKQE